MIVLDASILIAHFSSTDAHHDAAQTILEGAVDERLSIHPLTLAEVLVGAARHKTSDRLRCNIRALGVEQWEPDEHEPARISKIRAELGLKLPDCCVLSAAIVTGGELATFDQTLAAAARHLDIDMRV